MAVISYEYMTPPQKVAALLIGLGPTTAAEILKNIPNDEMLEQITIEITALNKVSPEVLNSIIEEFHSYFIASNYISTGGMQYAQTLLKKAYGNEEADEILNRLMTIMSSNPFQFFNEADPAQLATSFQGENPQLIALILAYIRPEHSAKILNALPAEIQADVAIKLAEMNTINPEILKEVEKIVETKFSSVVTKDFSKVGGVKALANILNRTDRATEKNVIDMLEYENPEIAEGVRELMFVFEDIVKLDDKSIQRILREVDTRDIALSLKGTKEDLKEKIFKNLSERAQSILSEDMEYMGPVRAKDVQTVQGKIVAIIRQLETDGEIIIVRNFQEDELIE